MPRYLLGIDVGTSGTKTVLVDEDGVVTDTAYVGYGIDTQMDDWAEQDPDAWVQAACDTINKVVSKSGISDQDIAGIGFSGQMHGTVCLDSNGDPLLPATIWADQRSAAEVEYICDNVGLENLARWTSNPIATGFQAATLLWLVRHRPEITDRIYTVLLPKDYVRYRLTGEIGTEASDASSTLLFDVARRRWSKDMLGALDLPQSWLPAVAESSDIAGELTDASAKSVGLRSGIPVMYGGADQPIAAVGNGVTQHGSAQSTIGTGGQIFLSLDWPLVDSQLRTHSFCHTAPDRWYLMAATLSAGLSLKWFREQVLQASHDLSYSDLSDEASAVAAGSEGLFFAPYLAGERTPHMDPHARGGFVGLTLRHSRAHMTRAIMEGVTYGLREGLEIMRGLGAEVNQVVASGGGARSPLWRQLQADILGCQVVTTNVAEQAGLGAALIAGVGVGVWSSIEEAASCGVVHSDPIDPDAERARFYDVQFGKYRLIYPALRSVIHPAA